MWNLITCSIQSETLSAMHCRDVSKWNLSIKQTFNVMTQQIKTIRFIINAIECEAWDQYRKNTIMLLSRKEIL
jgi:hypothetical protein